MPAPPALLAIGLIIGLLILVPSRRLQLAGFGGRAIGSYAAILWVLGFVLAVRPAGSRFLVPILLVAYLAPFVTAPGRMARIVRRGRTGRGPDEPPPPPIKNVTPPPDGPAGTA